jgi:hypothetical protein
LASPLLSLLVALAPSSLPLLVLKTGARLNAGLFLVAVGTTS